MRGFLHDLTGVVVFFVFLCVLPLILPNEYYVNVLIICGLNAIVVVGLNLLLGYAGQISLGHAAFYGLAAYTTAIVTSTLQLPIFLGIFTAVLLVAVIAFLIAIPTLKLSGHYLAMATLGFGVIVHIFFNQTDELTGGPSGFVGIPRLELFGVRFTSDLSYYFLVVSVLSVITLLSLNLIRSRIGRALLAIHTSEKAAQVSCINITKYKRFIFVLSAVFAAISGVLYAHYLEFVAPSSFGFTHSILFITMVVLGGMGNIWGAVFGAFFLTILPEVLRQFENIEVLIYGLILILGIMFLPEGIVGGLQKIWKFLVQKKAVEKG